MQLLQKDFQHTRMGYSVTGGCRCARRMASSGLWRWDRTRQDPIGEDWQSPHYQRP